MTMAHTDNTSLPVKSASTRQHKIQLINKYDDAQWMTSHYTDHQQHELENEIDPDNNFLLDINENCRYYTDEQFNQNINKNQGNLSIIHFNSRSLNKNFKDIKDYLLNFSQPFQIITMCETWINSGDVSDFELDGYELIHVNRQCKRSGGVAIYVDNSIRFTVIDDMTTVVDDFVECITIELIMEKRRNIIISCLYRDGEGSIKDFTEWMNTQFLIKGNKDIFISGDYNIDLLNPYKIKAIDDFIDNMYSLSLFPKITRPSRFTSHSATLIDNILTNDLNNKTVSGLLITDLTDHLPVFVVFDGNNRNKKDCPEQIQYRRTRSEESIDSLKTDLLEHDWDEIYSNGDANSAYSKFLNIFIAFYNKNCPLREWKRKSKHASCPWITKGLQNACKKKNTLYKEFIKVQTKEAEARYKKYKNKLTHIIRMSRKDFFFF